MYSHILKALHFIMLSLFLSLPAYAESPPTPVGKVVWVKGNLTALMSNNEERKLQKDSVIYLKDTLETGPDSQAQIVFTDGSLITFEKDTKFVVEDYKFNPDNKKSAGKSVMSLVRGGFRTITGLIAKKNPPDYSVRTPVATIGVRGTDYVVHLKNNQLYMGHYDGKPCMQNDKGALCMDDIHKYGEITLDKAPTLLTEQPEFFKEKLYIQPARVTFDFPKTTVIRTNGSGTPGGGKNSFCIA